MRTLYAELKKSRRRHNTLVAVCISLFVLLWATQTGSADEGRLEQGYSGLFYAVPVMNTVVMPLGTAVLASRLWDLESKGNSCRMLLTLQSRGTLFLGKSVVALLQILLIVVIESVGILTLGKHFGFTELLDWGQLLWLAISTFAVNFMLFFLWLFLSIRFDNQVPTLAAGMVGSLSGLFAAFMPSQVSYFMPWGYYIPLSTIRMDWNRETRIVRYYPTPYPVWLLILTAAFGALFAAMAWEALKHKEVLVMLLRCIRAENRKLRRSPIWLLFLAVPAISAVYGTFNYNMNLGILTHGWYDLWTQYTLFYAIFFFAPLIGVYAAYLWRLEHRGHNWNLIMTAPVRPFCLYFAKFCVVTKMAVLTQGWMLALFIIGGKCGAKLPGFPPPEIVLWLLRGVIGGLAIIALQLLLSMVIRNFALPVLIALGGSVAGLLATSEDLGLYWPYSLMIMGMNSNRTEDVMAGGIWGFFLSCAVFLTVFLLIANVLLTKRDVKV